jgi:hypothetical protein
LIFFSIDTFGSQHLLPKIIESLGYVPFDLKEETLGDRIIAYRKKTD